MPGRNNSRFLPWRILQRMLFELAPAASEGEKVMDIEKLIEKLRTESLYKDKATLEIMDLCMEAADAIEQLQTTVEQAKWDLDIAYDLANKNARLFDEMQKEWDERGEGCGVKEGQDGYNL